MYLYEQPKYINSMHRIDQAFYFNDDIHDIHSNKYAYDLRP